MRTLGHIVFGLTLTTSFLTVLFYLLSGLLGAAFGLLFSLGVITYAFSSSDKKIIRDLSLNKIVGKNPYDLNDLSSRWAKVAKVSAPQVFTSDQPYAQAFTFGRSGSRPKIVIFNELLDRLSPAEIDTLLALLVAQIKVKSQLSHSISSVFIQFILLTTQFLDGVFRFLSGVKYSQHKKRAQPFTVLIGPFISFYVGLFQTKSNVHRTDRFAADWLDNQQRVSRLINKVHSYSLSSALIPPLRYAHIFITSPLTSLKWGRYLSWQPCIKLRTHRLAGHYPA